MSCSALKIPKDAHAWNQRRGSSHCRRYRGAVQAHRHFSPCFKGLWCCQSTCAETDLSFSPASSKAWHWARDVVTEVRQSQRSESNLRLPSKSKTEEQLLPYFSATESRQANTSALLWLPLGKAHSPCAAASALLLSSCSAQAPPFSAGSPFLCKTSVQLLGTGTL